jgi:hypothetical protein
VRTVHGNVDFTTRDRDEMENTSDGDKVVTDSDGDMTSDEEDW